MYKQTQNLIIQSLQGPVEKIYDCLLFQHSFQGLEIIQFIIYQMSYSLDTGSSCYLLC